MHMSVYKDMYLFIYLFIYLFMYRGFPVQGYVCMHIRRNVRKLVSGDI